MPYVLGVTGGFFLFCLLLKWQPWHVRLHLPLFVLGAPAMGMVLGQLRRQGPVLAVTALVLAASVPWVLGNATRPLTPSPSAIIDHFVRGKPLPLTIITADRSQQYFTNRPALWRPYSVITSLIKKSGAGNIGLHLNGEDWEYPLWVLLDDADGSGPRIEHVEVRNRSGTIGLVNFHPDLIVQFDVQGYPVLTGPQGRGFD